MNKKEKPEWITRIIIMILLLLFLGFLVDASTGFGVVQKSGSILGGVGILLTLGLLYLFGEGIGELVSGIDKVEQPLWRRTFNLAILLAAVGIVCGVFYYVLSYI